MLTTEFNQEMGALIRSLEIKVRMEPALSRIPAPPESLDVGEVPVDVRITLDHIERAIVSLVALHISLRSRRDSDS